MSENTTTSRAPSAAALTADHVIDAINAATAAALEDGPPLHPAARRDGVVCLYLRAIGLGLAVVGAELEAMRDRP